MTRLFAVTALAKDVKIVAKERVRGMCFVMDEVGVMAHMMFFLLSSVMRVVATRDIREGPTFLV